MLTLAIFQLHWKITAKVGIKHQLINQSMIILQIYNHHENQLLYSLQDQDILKENLPVTQIKLVFNANFSSNFPL
jgi:hypothetical protein